ADEFWCLNARIAGAWGEGRSILDCAVNDIKPLEEVHQEARQPPRRVEIGKLGRLLEFTADVANRVEPIATAFALHLVAQPRNRFGFTVLRRRQDSVGVLALAGDETGNKI